MSNEANDRGCNFFGGIDDDFEEDDFVCSKLDQDFVSDKLPTSKSFLERDNFESELGPASEDPFAEDFSDISSHGIVEVFGEDVVGRPIVAFYAFRLPCNKSFNHTKFLRFMQSTLDKLVDQDYTIIYFHYGLRSNNKPSIRWLLSAYQLIDRRFKKNLKALYLVHPTKFIKVVWKLFQPLISIKFQQKIHYFNSLKELNSVIPLSNLVVPSPILSYDRETQPGSSILDTQHRPSSPPRPTKQFNVSLQFILDHNPNSDIPPIVSDLIEFLIAHGLYTKGIFRRSGSVSLIKELIEKINLGERIDFLQYPPFEDDTQNAVIHAAVLLKTFLRSLGEPVITNKLYPQLAQLNGVSKENRLSAVKELVFELPQENYQLLKTIIKFLSEVSNHSQENLMDASNLSVVFGPNLTWPTDQQVSILQLNNLNNFCFTLIKHYDEIFLKS